MAELGSAVFLSWVRGGITKDSQSTGGQGLPRLRAKVGVDLLTTAANDHVDAAFDLLGPADTSGFSPAQVLRTDPKASEPAAEPNYLASIEFDAPEIPWLLSPTASTPEAVQPWIALVVVVDEPGRLESRAGTVHPVLRCDATQLPPCQESWAWAHAQIIPHSGRSNQDMLTDPTEVTKTLARLICPTRLRPNTKYLACVVPTYAAGVETVFGGDAAAAGDKPAWGASGQVTLPVFYHWRFRTGPIGDFEEIATELKAVKAETLKGIGRSNLAIAPGGLPGLEGEPPAIPAVRTLLTTTAEIDALAAETVAANVQKQLAEIVTPDAAPADPPVVQPPAYGRWPAQLDHIDQNTGGWISGVNLAPSQRVIARLGGDVVRTQQEELVAEARRQAGAYLAARRARDLLRLGELTATRLTQRRFTDVPSARVIAMARPAHFAIQFDETVDVATRLSGATVDPGMLMPALNQVATRSSRQMGVNARSVRAGLVTGAFDHTFRSPDASVAEQPIDFGKVNEIYTRASLMDKVVDNVPMAKLIEVAPQVIAAQTTLVDKFTAQQFEIQPIDPDVRRRRVRATQGQSPFQRSFNVMNDVSFVVPVEEVHPDVDVQRVGRVHLNEEVVRPIDDQILVHPVDEGAPVLHVREGQQFHVDEGIAAEAAVRLTADEQTTISNTIFETLGPTFATLNQGQAAQPIATDAFVLDATTAQFGKTFREKVGGDDAVVQVSVKASVRAQLGLTAPAPILRDQLTADVQARFDQAVTQVTLQTLLPSIAYPAATNVIGLNDVAQACTVGLAVAGTYKTAADSIIRRNKAAFILLPTEINLGFVPTFTAPLASRLERSLNSWILAGASSIPANGITLVSTNPSFIESFVVGANHEVAGEMLWRDVPSDPRGTVFTRFWANSELPPVHKWMANLGGNVDNGRPLVAVVMRSPLLRRYPNTIIYAAKRLETPGDNSFTPDPATITPVLYQGFIEPDATFSVIDLDINKARDPDEKWFILISQPVTDARFGLDEWIKAEDPPPPQDWNDLTWRHMGDATLRPRPGSPPQPANPGDAVWGRSAADLALILHQDPFRIVLPAASYLPDRN